MTAVGFGKYQLQERLGETERVQSAEIRWVNGSSITFREPAVDHYYDVRSSGQSGTR